MTMAIKVIDRGMHAFLLILLLLLLLLLFMFY